MGWIRLSDRHRAPDHVGIGQFEMVFQGGAQHAPAFLHARPPATLFREQCQGLKVHASVTPLTMSHPLIDDDECRHGGVKETEIVGEPGDARCAIFSRNAKRFVHHLAHFAAARFVGLPEVFRINGAICWLTLWVCSQYRRGHAADGILGVASDDNGSPRLCVAAGGRPLGLIQPLADIGFRKCIGLEGPCGDTLRDCL